MGNVPLDAVVFERVLPISAVDVEVFEAVEVGISVCFAVDVETAGRVVVVRTAFFPVGKSSTADTPCVVTLEADTVLVVEQLDVFAEADVGLCAFKAFFAVKYVNT